MPAYISAQLMQQRPEVRGAHAHCAWRLSFAIVYLRSNASFAKCSVLVLFFRRQSQVNCFPVLVSDFQGRPKTSRFSFLPEAEKLPEAETAETELKRFSAAVDIKYLRCSLIGKFCHTESMSTKHSTVSVL